MELKYQLFLDALKAYFNGKKTDWDFEISMENWRELFALAEQHKVQPLIFEAVYDCPVIHSMEEEFFHVMKRRGMGIMLHQVQKTARSLDLYQFLQKKNLRPLVVKGMVCRELYPVPDLRVSADEDFFVEAADFERYVEAFQEFGLEASVKTEDIKTRDEIGFVGENGLCYVELHKNLFAGDSEVYGQWNTYFSDCFSSAVPMKVQGTTIYTLEPQMHLFYLICHSLKHFLHSGFGIRQVSDIGLFANVYGREIDWQKLLVQCREIHGEKFAAALFKIAKTYLGFDEERACYPAQWQEINVDEKDLLEDLLCGGVYGGSSMSRRHSSNITLDAAAAGKMGKKPGNGLKASLFPAARKLEGKYTYLKKKPYLLPVAWGERIVKYCKEVKASEDDHAMEAVNIGNRRVKLLEQYEIIKK